MYSHDRNIAVFAKAQVAEMSCANALHLNKIFIFIFLKTTLNVSGGKINFVNPEQFWFEHYSAEHKLLIVEFLVSFTEKESRSIGLSSLEDKFQQLFDQSPENKKHF